MLRMLLGWRFDPASHLRFTENPTFLKSVQNRIIYTFGKIGFFDIPDFSDFGTAPDRRLKFLPQFEVEPAGTEGFPLHT